MALPTASQQPFRINDAYVIKNGDKNEQLDVDSCTEGGDFSASPAVNTPREFAILQNFAGRSVAVRRKLVRFSPQRMK